MWCPARNAHKSFLKQVVVEVLADAEVLPGEVAEVAVAANPVLLVARRS